MVVFTCNHCPAAVSYENRLVRLQADYARKGVQLVAINPNHPVCKVARAGLLKANSGDRDLVRAMDATQLECTPRVTGLTPFLAMLGNLGTLLGLIGTISGLQASFSSLAAVEASKKAVMLAAGIAEGARLACGGPGKPEGLDTGYYCRPTVFAAVMATLMFGAWFTDAIGIYAVFGAFIAGTAMPKGTPLSRVA